MIYRSFDRYVNDYRERGRQLSEWLVEKSIPRGLKSARRWKLYVRCAIRVVGGFEIANIEVPEDIQKRGLFSSFLDKWETKVPLLIENVQNSALEEHMQKRAGWHIVDELSRPDICTTFVNELWKQRDRRFQQQLERID